MVLARVAAVRNPRNPETRANPELIGRYFQPIQLSICISALMTGETTTHEGLAGSEHQLADTTYQRIDYRLALACQTPKRGLGTRLAPIVGFIGRSGRLTEGSLEGSFGLGRVDGTEGRVGYGF
jgi:hypothetical protein